MRTKLLKLLFSAFILALPGMVHAAPTEGDVAPDFRLQDQDSEWHSLSDYKGSWVVLYFYPKDDTPGCTTEACNFRDEIIRYKALGAKVLGVSLDDVESHKEFAEKYSLPFPLLADEKKKAAEAYDVITSYIVTEVAARETFIINPEGVISRHYEDVDPDTHAQEVLDYLKSRVKPASPANGGESG